MSATTVAAPVSTTRAWALTVRLAVLAFAAVVLLATAFVVGRTTAHSTVNRVPAIAPASTHASSSDTYTPHCRVGVPC